MVGTPLGSLQMPLITLVNDLVACSGLDDMRKSFPQAILDKLGSVFTRDLFSNSHLRTFSHCL